MKKSVINGGLFGYCAVMLSRAASCRLKVHSPVMSAVLPLIVSTEPLLSFGLRHFLKESGMLRCLEAETMEMALELVGRFRPGIVLVCAEPGQMEVTRLLRQLRRGARSLPMLVISRDKSCEHVQRCLEAGAQAYLTHGDALAELGMACATVLRGGLHLSAAVVKGLLPARPGRSAAAAQPVTDACLSTREREVFALVGCGCGCKEIAGRLGISVKTVETHQMRMKQKLGVERSAELKRLAEGQAKTAHQAHGGSPRLSKALASA